MKFRGTIATLAIYLTTFGGFMWLYQDNHQFQRQTDNGIIYLQSSIQQLSNRLTGTDNPKPSAHQTEQNSTINSQNDQFKGRWTHRKATIYIDMQNPTFQNAMKEAVTAWNNTGAFHFEITNNKKQADLVATSSDNHDDQAAGLAEMHQNSISGYFTDGHIYLNKAYLLNPEYGYTHERIVNTAEHELGHAIGLSHNNNPSVMQPSGSFYAIQRADIQAVNDIYSKQPTK